MFEISLPLMLTCVCLLGVPPCGCQRTAAPPPPPTTTSEPETTTEVSTLPGSTPKSYHTRFDYDLGGYRIEETTLLNAGTAAEQLNVMGKAYLLHPSDRGQVSTMLTYMAGEKGYVASYEIKPVGGLQFDERISMTGLKTITG